MSRVLHALVMGAIVVAAIGCGDADDPYNLTDGDVVSDTTTYTGIDYELTSDNYRRWLAANDALDSTGVDVTTRLDPRSATDDDIERVVRALSTDDRARAAIESADISVRDYVLTSVALAQSWDAVDRPGQVAGVPPGNVAFLRTQQVADQPTVRRPRARFIGRADRRDHDEHDDRHDRHEREADDDDDDDDNEGRDKRRGRGKGKRGRG